MQYIDDPNHCTHFAHNGFVFSSAIECRQTKTEYDKQTKSCLGLGSKITTKTKEMSRKQKMRIYKSN